MKKLTLLTLAFFLVSNPFIVVGQNQANKPSLGVEGKAEYAYLVDGLKQFPAKYPTSRGYVRATIHGFGIGNPVTENGKVFESKLLNLVTEDGQNLNILVVGPEIEFALFMHEMRPHTGKYKFWSPVLEFKGKHNDWVYSWYEIEVVGRFFIENNDSTDPNKATGYKNEVYR